MRNWFSLIIILLLSVTMAACTSNTPDEPAEAKSKTVLFVGIDTGGDGVLINRFKEKGFQVTVVSDKEASAEQAEQHSLVYVSATVDASVLGSKLKEVKVPVLFASAASVSQHGLIGSDSYLHYGYATNGRTVVISKPEHPVASGLKDTVEVYSATGRIGYIVPNNDSSIVASFPNTPGRALAAAFEKGTNDVNGLALPERRGFYYCITGMEIKQTEAGWKLFDSLVEWTFGSSI